MSKKLGQKKPYPDFPLFPHASGQWAKKILGKLVYFGVDPVAALNKYLAERDHRQAGQEPRAEGSNLKQLCNCFLTAKQRLLDAGDFSPATWRNYYDLCQRLIAFWVGSTQVQALRPEDFDRLRSSLAETRGPAALASSIQKVRTIFKFAADTNLIDRPLNLGPGFRKPSRKAMRQARQAAGTKMIEAVDIRRVIAAAGVHLQAMIYLGVNCGFGNSDVANLPLSHIDLNRGWISFPRPKTAIERRIPMWPETIAAIRASLAKRPTPKDRENDGGLVFITKYGARWVRYHDREKDGAVAVDAVGLAFSRLLTSLGLKRKRLSFYSLRHIFRTVADGAKDGPAADAIMGHVGEHISQRYVERIEDDRLIAIANHVRQWLFAGTPG